MMDHTLASRLSKCMPEFLPTLLILFYPDIHNPGQKCMHMRMICGASHTGSHVGQQTLKIHARIPTDSTHFVLS